MPYEHYSKMQIAGLPTDPMILAGMSIDELKAAGLNQRQAYAVRRTATADYRSQGANDSVKQKALALITSQGPFSDVQHLRSTWGVGAPSPYDLTKALWALQKNGEITFYEKKQGKDSLLFSIKLPKGTTHRALKAKGNGHHPVGVDMTEARNHKDTAIAVSGDLRARPKTPTVVPTVVVPVVKEADPVVPRYSGDTPLPQNTKPVIDEGSLSSADLLHADAANKDVDSDTHTQYPDVTVDKYPAMFHLLDLKANNAAFEKAAEALIDVDEATMNMLLGKATTFSTLEKEVIRFLESRRD